MHVYLRLFVTAMIILCSHSAIAQYNPPLFLKATQAEEREKTHDRIIKNVILKNLSFPLSNDTEENWEGAFNAMEVINYSDVFTWQKMQEAMTSLPFQSITFQRHVLETAFSMYPGQFVKEAQALIQVTADPKIFSMCAVYLLKSTNGAESLITPQLQKTFGDSAVYQPILSRLMYQMDPLPNNLTEGSLLKIVFNKNFLPGQTILFSFQRKDRDYPGLAIVRKANGEFVKDGDELFAVPQLARGIAGLPYFLTKGNTPQGIFRMFGFGVSQSQFIGPTANIQMGMPVELKKNKFLPDSKDSNSWTIQDYAALLPASLRNYQPMFESYYAGLAGRNEIIAHGTTINPDYYKGKPFYPMTPTEGCLCTKEFWDGKLIYSDQQKLVNALLSAGGAKGFVVVLDIDEQQGPVTSAELETYLKR